MHRLSHTVEARWTRARCTLPFTLVEMLAVMGVMGSRLAIVAPAATQILRGNGLTQSGELLGDQIVLARQNALTSSRPVQVRFYQLPATSTGGDVSYSAIQSFRLDEDGQARPLTKLETFRQGVICKVDTKHKFSTLLSPPSDAAPTVSGKEKLAAYNGQECNYVGFQFLPNGSTDLDPTAATPSGGWFVTLVDANRPDTGSDDVPVNYYTVRVEPLDGRVQAFRP